MMKSRVLVAAVFFAFFCFAAGAFAQTPTDEKPKQETSTIDDIEKYTSIFLEKFEKLKEKFKITEDQSTQIKNIVFENAPQLVADYMKIKTAPKEKREELAAAFQNNVAVVKEKVFETLTPGQRTEAEKLLKDKIGSKIEKAKDADENPNKKN